MGEEIGHQGIVAKEGSIKALQVVRASWRSPCLGYSPAQPVAPQLRNGRSVGSFELGRGEVARKEEFGLRRNGTDHAAQFRSQNCTRKRNPGQGNRDAIGQDFPAFGSGDEAE